MVLGWRKHLACRCQWFRISECCNRCFWIKEVSYVKRINWSRQTHEEVMFVESVHSLLCSLKKNQPTHSFSFKQNWITLILWPATHFNTHSNTHCSKHCNCNRHSKNLRKIIPPVSHKLNALLWSLKFEILL